MSRKSGRRWGGTGCRSIAPCIMTLVLLILAGCVEQTLGPDRNAYLGSQIVIISSCTPEDPGTYTYRWVCTRKPAEIAIEVMTRARPVEVIVLSTAASRDAS